MAHIDWYIEGQSFGKCTCNYGCPGPFEDRPSHGHGTGFEGLHIDKGHFGDIDLEGLQAALFYAWPGPIFQDNRTRQVIIDDSYGQLCITRHGPI